MFGSNPTERYLGPLSEDILAALIEATDESEGLSREEAIGIVRQANETHPERFWSGEPEHLTAEVEEILDDLVNRGYLYRADDGLRVTSRDILQ